MAVPKTSTRPGLRERKKAKTRAEIQRHALRLFAEQGYHETTVDQIADAAEVSPSTFFRYFPTKEAVALNDEYDEPIMRAGLAQPPDMPPIRMIRNAMSQVFGALSADERAAESQRMKLLMQVPELRAASVQQNREMITMMAAVLAERLHVAPDDVGIAAMVGAVIGVGQVIHEQLAAKSDVDFGDYVKRFDDVLAHLETVFDR